MKILFTKKWILMVMSLSLILPFGSVNAAQGDDYVSVQLLSNWF
ncbi:hypothetical protein [Alkalibacillus aidingensis]|nr:hypothetical protein [Alkalibacillus aidingensis]